MGYGPVVMKQSTPDEELEIVFRFATSLEDEGERAFLLEPMFTVVAQQVGLLRREDGHIVQPPMAWDRKVIIALPAHNRAVAVELIRQAEPTGPVSLEPDEQLDWHSIKSNSKKHRNIVYEARIIWADGPLG